MANLFTQAYRCLLADTATDKVYLTILTALAWQQNRLSCQTPATAAVTMTQPGQPARLQLVPPKAVPRRRLGAPEGRIALLHAIAHIEFNAINLAWDAVYRFRELPPAYYADWVKVALEEAWHFSLIQTQLQQAGVNYGDLPAHNGLWEMAVETDYDPMVRMALVPRLLEARGLDATPAIIRRLQAEQDQVLISILDIILHDEIGHVAIGSQWFHYFCQQRGLTPEKTFQNLLSTHFMGQLRGPFNHPARLAAGFSAAELAVLENWNSGE
jgi:uncharacterized ferritin-like protein (DUF455 family)